MRILHTSDWHLGHVLHQMSRDVEHAAFLDWLVEVAHREAVDAVVIAGDVFDNANPPATAQTAWFGFLHRLTQRVPGVEVVVIAGNHDSPARLAAPAELLAPLGVRVVGRVEARDGELDVESLVIPLHRDGRGGAWVVAVPFLRPSDLPVLDIDDAVADPLVEGVGWIYERACQAARERMQTGQSMVVMGHLYAAGTELSRLSERRILGGNQHALPFRIFPTDATYVALGHLHKAQRLGGTEHIRYCGSPLPLSLAEADYKHQVLVVDLDGAAAEVRSIPVPRVVDIVRVPRRGAAPLDEVLAELATLPPLASAEPETRPFLEVCVQLDRPQPNLRVEIEQAVADKSPRLAKLGVSYTGDGAALADGLTSELRDLDPEEVFVRRYQRDHQGEVPAPLLAAFREVLAVAEEEPG